VNLFADGNVDRQIVERLRADGHNVVFITEVAPSMDDDDILNWANREQALLITADNDFGELVYRQNRAAFGVILIRLSGLSNESKAAIVSSLIAENTSELVGSFTVLTPGVARIRKRLQ
jgi:predicted nuclease of predicted toxin-antitoxin system